MYIVIKISAGTSDLLQGEKLRCFTPYFNSVNQHNESSQTAAATKCLHFIMLLHHRVCCTRGVTQDETH